ncbi:MAG: TolC family protein [Pseudomonadota bacterium]
MSLSWRLLLAFAGTSLLSLSVAAAQLEPSRRAPPFKELLRSVDGYAPRLKELEANVEVAQGNARQARAWLNPGVSVEVEDVAGTSVYRGSSQAQTTFAISQPLEIGGQHGARAEAGRAALRLAQAEDAVGHVEFAYELAVAYAVAEGSERRVALVGEQLQLADEDRRAARALVDAGREAELRAVQAGAVVSSAQAQIEVAQADRQDALIRLAVLAGEAKGYDGITPSLLEQPRQSGGDVSSADVEGLPDVRAAAAAVELADRRLSVERRRVLPTPSVSAGLRRFNGTDDTAWVFGVSVAVPLFDRNRGGVDAAKGERSAAQAREASARLEGEAQLGATVLRLRASERRVAAALEAERASREAYELARTAYEAGRIALIEMLTTRRAWTDAQLALVDARVARVTTTALLARLGGRIPFVE